MNDPFEGCKERAQVYQELTDRPLSELSLEELKVLNGLHHQALEVAEEIRMLIGPDAKNPGRLHLPPEGIRILQDAVEKHDQEKRSIEADLIIIAGLIKQKEQNQR